MCLVACSIGLHSQYPLIVATNRDEFYSRPARPAEFWTDEGIPEMLAGKDLQAGGTWFGVNRRGRWGLVTNYRDPSIQIQDPPSRGQLIPAFLSSDLTASDWLNDLHTTGGQYNGFNLLLGEGKEVWYYSNIEKKIRPLTDGSYTLSNALLDVEWPKTKRIGEAFRSLHQKTSINESDLLSILTDTTQAPLDQLPDTGIPLKLEKAVSPVFIQTPEYGTRCSTVLMMHMSGAIHFTERTYLEGDLSKHQDRTFVL